MRNRFDFDRCLDWLAIFGPLVLIVADVVFTLLLAWAVVFHLLPWIAQFLQVNGVKLP